jgi:membrane fusion protein, multidrug efflux system
MIMKKLISVIWILILLLACTGPDKKTQLENLKKEKDKLGLRIAELEKEVNPAGNVPITTVGVEPLKKQLFDHYIEVQGRIDGNENIAVSPRSPGVVTKIYVKEGDFVKKGQLLAELDADVAKQNLKDLQSQLVYATDMFNRQKALWDQKIGSEAQYLDLKNKKESLENKIASQQELVNMSSITSPIDGTIEDIPVKVGQMASAQNPQPAFRIINFTKAKAVADVGEAYTAKINTGDQVRIFLPDFNQEIQEKVTFASKFINPTNRTFSVEIELPAEGKVYRANMIAVIRIKDYSNPSTIAVPQNFIQSSKNEGQYVFVAKEENGKKVARKIFIKSGISYNGLTEVTDGLNEGDKLITAGYKDLYDGQVIDYK